MKSATQLFKESDVLISYEGDVIDFLLHDHRNAVVLWPLHADQPYEIALDTIEITKEAHGWHTFSSNGKSYLFYKNL